MGITKADLKHDTKFIYKNKSKHIFYFRSYKGGAAVCVDILLNTFQEKAINGNHYNVQSLTDKYLTIWDIQFNEKRTYKVALEDLNIVNTEYKLI